MNSFLEPSRTLAAQPPGVGVLLGQTDVGKGREELYRDQLPELLVSLAAQTRVESIRASTAIEGYDVPGDRAENLAATPPARVRNRNEKEFAGYRDAIDGLIRAEIPEPLSVPFVLHLHRQLYAHSGGRGGHLKGEDNEIVRYDEAGRRELIFAPVPWQQTELMLSELLVRYDAARQARVAHPLVLLGVFTLDFLAIHPVADGNGRLARLLTTHELLRGGYGVARYVSIEQRIFESKNAYYESLRASQVGWHEAAHDPWPWIEYFAGVMARAYEDFEAKVASARSTAGLNKYDTVRRHVELMAIGTVFRFRDLRVALPGISDQTLRLALNGLRDDGLAAPSGSGRGAYWTRTSPAQPNTGAVRGPADARTRSGPR